MRKCSRFAVARRRRQQPVARAVGAVVVSQSIFVFYYRLPCTIHSAFFCGMGAIEISDYTISETASLSLFSANLPTPRSGGQLATIVPLFSAPVPPPL